jgi:hypothetical protein
MIRVNGELIDPNLVEEAFNRIKAEAESRLQISCCERDPEFTAQAEEEVIDSILIAQEAEKRHPDIPAEAVRERLEDTIKLYRKHGASWDMLEAQRDQLRIECEANLRMETFIGELTKDLPDPTDDDFRKYYQDHINEFRTVAEARCLHLIKFLEGHDDHIALLETMRRIRAQAVEGADFEELARNETEKESGDIDLGWITLDRPTNPIESMVFSMTAGEVSPVMSYEHAFHLIQVTRTKPSVTREFDEVRDTLEERFLADRRHTVLRKFAANLREKADIERVNFSDGDDE